MLSYTSDNETFADTVLNTWACSVTVATKNSIVITHFIFKLFYPHHRYFVQSFFEEFLCTRLQTDVHLRSASGGLLCVLLSVHQYRAVEMLNATKVNKNYKSRLHKKIISLSIMHVS